MITLQPSGLRISHILPGLRAGLVATCSVALNALASPPDISEYGQLPAAESMVISPDGKHYAMIRHEGDESYFVVVNAATQEMIGGGRLDKKARTRSLYFATNDHLLIRASETRRTFGSSRKIQFSGAYAYSISKKKTRVLLNKSDELYAYQGGLGRVVGVNAE